MDWTQEQLHNGAHRAAAGYQPRPPKAGPPKMLRLSCCGERSNARNVDRALITHDSVRSHRRGGSNVWALASAGLALVAIAATPTSAAVPKADAILRSLIGKDEAAIERNFGLPDERETNGVQTFLRYRSFDSWRISGRPHRSRGRVNFDCLTTLVLRDGILRAYEQNGIGCR